MQVRVLGSSASGTAWGRSGSLLAEGRVAFDTGGLTCRLSEREQAEIKHVFLTHAHLDHVGELAFLLDNIAAESAAPLKVWAPGPVLAQITQHLFNNQIWPDFSQIRIHNHPIAEFCSLDSHDSLVVEGMRIRWARTSHPVYSVGYLVEDALGAFLYTGDTGPTEAIWKLAHETDRLRAVFVESTFPDRLREMALLSGHLTPALLERELTKLHSRDAAIKVMHIKPKYYPEIQREIESLGHRWRILSGGEFFDFSSPR